MSDVNVNVTIRVDMNQTPEVFAWLHSVIGGRATKRPSCIELDDVKFSVTTATD